MLARVSGRGFWGGLAVATDKAKKIVEALAWLVCCTRS
jgi:hypothetical protein